MSTGAEPDAERIAAAVRACPRLAGLHSGRFGEIATYLPGRRIPGVRIRPEAITVGVIGRYPVTAAQTTQAVHRAVGPADRAVAVHIGDIAIPGVDEGEHP